MTKWFVVLAAVIMFMFSAVPFLAVAQDTEPAPNVVLVKSTLTSPPGTVRFQITATNNGNSDTAEPVYVYDALSDDATWFLLSAYVTDGDDIVATDICTLDAGVLTCEVESLLGRHLNKAKDNFVHGSLSVIVQGITKRCGLFPNHAYVISLTEPREAFATGEDPCPSTPTPVPNTPTPTAVPSTPTPTATAPPEVPTATPTRKVPLPPNTEIGRASCRERV